MREVRPSLHRQFPPRTRMNEALLIVDVQNDFCPRGALAVKEGDAVVVPLNAAIRHAERHDVPVFYTRDWHPADHCSFTARGGPWPPHCIAGTTGAEFHPGLRVPDDAIVLSKAQSPATDAYSGFGGTDLAERLRRRGVERVVIGGLTLDYCVKETALDALKAGFDVLVLEDATRAVEAAPGDGARAMAALHAAGAQFLTTDDYVSV